MALLWEGSTSSTQADSSVSQPDWTEQTGLRTAVISKVLTLELLPSQTLAAAAAAATEGDLKLIRVGTTLPAGPFAVDRKTTPRAAGRAGPTQGHGLPHVAPACSRGRPVSRNRMFERPAFAWSKSTGRVSSTGACYEMSLWVYCDTVAGPDKQDWGVGLHTA